MTSGYHARDGSVFRNSGVCDKALLPGRDRADGVIASLSPRRDRD
jgi:hypothetical protein